MTDALTSVGASDDAVIFTLAYLDKIEKNLNIRYSDQGEPICVPGEITVESLDALTHDLGILLRGLESQRALAAVRSFGGRHVQSVGFGHVSDFDALVKIGLLYSERVVLWDLLGSRILSPDNISDTAKNVIADIACNLLLLRSVVALGAVVVLPHPLLWSEKARQISSKFSILENASATALGLLFALAAIDNGLQLHPFTLNNSTNPVSNGLGIAVTPDVRLNKAHEFSFGMKSLMERSDFQFLRDIPLENFYKTVARHPEFPRALRKQFVLLSGLSATESEKEMDAVSDELKKILITRANAIANYWVDGSLATASVITGAITMTASPVGATLLGIAGITPAFLTAVRRLFARPSKDVIVNAFSDLHSEAPFSLDFITQIPDITHLETKNLDPDLLDHISTISNEPWTEDAHQYLENLEESTAIDVLNALPPEQIDQLVNYRHRQEDYIGDYLEFVWKLNPDAFWSHIEHTFTSADGMLMYDLDGVQQVLTSENMPLTVWMTLLKNIPSVYAEVLKDGKSLRYKNETGSYVSEHQADQLVEVFSYQLLESEESEIKQEFFADWIEHLLSSERQIVDILLSKVFSNDIPEWIPTAPA